jgi:putative ABC transport system permease protein
MLGPAEFARRLRDFFQADRAERQLDEEMRFHLEMEAEKNERQGMTPQEARRAAATRFGGLEDHKESVRDARGFRWMDEFLCDARYACRSLRRTPAFAGIAVATLAIGIGVTTAVFTLFNAVLLRPLPFRDAERLAVVYAQNREMQATEVNISYPDYLDWQRRVRAFAGFAVFNWGAYTLSGAEGAERVNGAEISATLLPVLGVEPLVGRNFTGDEQQPGRNRVMIIGYGLWKRRYAGDPAIVGRTITVDGLPYTIVGVMPPEFQFPFRGAPVTPPVWTPLAVEDWMHGRSNRGLAGAVGRLRPGVAPDEARAELARESARLERAHPGDNHAWEAQYVPMREDVFGSARTTVSLLFGGAALVLLVVCANVANLLLARGAARDREVSLRAAIGARRGRLIRQFLTESLVLVALGGALGIVLARWGRDVLQFAFADRLPAFAAIELDLAGYLFALGAAALVALLAGLFPALRATRVPLEASLQSGHRTTATRGGARLRSSLVVGEVALAVVLLVGSVLLLKSLSALQNIDPGFDARDVYVARFRLATTTYDTAERRRAFMKALLDRLRSQPGVADAGAAQGTPFSGWNVGTSYEVEGKPAARSGEAPITHVQSVTPEYFRVLRVPFIRGRRLAATDDDRGPRVAVVNEAFTRLHFTGMDPIARRFRFGRDDPWTTIVGVVGDFRHYALREPTRPAVYLPFAADPPPQMTIAVRASDGAGRVANTLRRVLQELDPDVAASGGQALAEVVARQTWLARVARDVIGTFAATAALLALVGLYGVISYSIVQQQGELGIRLALGAAPARVLRLVMRRGLTLAAIGCAIGCALALAASRSLSALLFEVAPVDAGTFVSVPLVVLALAALASFLPGRRAACIDPVRTLRAE